MRIPDHMNCLLRNLYAGQEATVRTGHGTTDWFRIGKEVRQAAKWAAILILHGKRLIKQYQNIQTNKQTK